LSSFEFKFETLPWFYPTTYCSSGESCLLVSWCAGGRCGVVDNDEDHGRSRRPGAKDQDDEAQVGYSVAE
jgi:hypothetical protein